MSLSRIHARAARAFLVSLTTVALFACGEVHSDDGSGNDDDDTPPTMGARNGEPCTLADECESALCVDGVCCDAACDGTCESCAVAGSVGTCAPQTAAQDLDDECPDEGACGLNGLCDGAGACAHYGADTVHSAQTCDAEANATSLADMCDGAGGVTDGGTIDCTPYVCDGDACGTTCVDSTDCAAGYFCDTGDVDGDFTTDECLPQRDDGDTCTADDRDVECSGGECSNGFCCSDIGGTCCGVVDDCPAPPPTCLDATTCSGQRTIPACAAHACDSTVVSDDTACAARVCSPSACADSIWTPTSTCSSSGACTAGGSPQTCDDVNPCTVDACDPTAGCQYVATSGDACDDGDACTLTDVCTDGVCGGTAKNCDDGSVCTDDACNPTTGDCEAIATSGGACDDEDACTLADVCTDGVCGGTAKNCDDGSVCTDDACDRTTGACTHEPTACTPGFAYRVLLANDGSLAADVFGFGDDFTTPAINNNGLVVVQARDIEGLPVIVVADEDGAKPLVTYTDFPAANWPALPSINDAAQIAFIAVVDGVRVVRVDTDASFTTIVAANDPTPDGGQFANFNGGGTAYTSPAILADGTVVFWAAFRDVTGATRNGVFAGADLDSVAQLIAGPTSSYYARIGASGGDYVVRQLLTPGDVLHGALSSGDLPSSLASVVGLRSGPSVNGEGLVAYVANDGAGLRAVFRSDSSLPLVDAEQGYSNMLNPHINLGGEIAFEATRSGVGPGVYLWDGDRTRAVAEAGAPLVDGVIKHVRFYRGLNDAGEIAFWTRLEDGREAIVLAAPACLGPPCDDGEACTVNDTCEAAVCVGAPTDGCP